MRNLINLTFLSQRKRKQQMSRKQKKGDREEATICRLSWAIPWKSLGFRRGAPLSFRASRPFRVASFCSGFAVRGAARAPHDPFLTLSHALTHARTHARTHSRTHAPISYSLAFCVFVTFVCFLSLWCENRENQINPPAACPTPVHSQSKASPKTVQRQSKDNPKTIQRQSKPVQAIPKPVKDSQRPSDQRMSK